MVRIFLRFVVTILISAVVSSQSFACSCPNISLQSDFALAKVVVVVEIGAQLDSTNESGDRIQIWPIIDAETLKGELSFKHLTAGDMGCGPLPASGDKYLVFTDASGIVSHCKIKLLRWDAISTAYIDVLRAYKNKVISSPTSPWAFHRTTYSCALSHTFDNGDTHIRFVYRLVDEPFMSNTQYSYPTALNAMTKIEGVMLHPANFAGFFELRVWYPSDEYVVEHSGKLRVGNREWSTIRRNLEHVSGGYEVVDAIEAMEVLDALANGARITTEVELADLPSDRIQRYSEYPAAISETPQIYLGESASKFRHCLEFGN